MVYGSGDIVSHEGRFVTVGAGLVDADVSADVFRPIFNEREQIFVSDLYFIFL